MTGEVTKRSSSANVMPRILKGKNVQEVRENLVLRERQSHHVNSDGLYIPMFYSALAAKVGRSRLKKAHQDVVSKIVGVGSFVTCFLPTTVLVNVDAVGLDFGFGGYIATAIIAIPAGIAFNMGTRNVDIMDKMMLASSTPFSMWARRRYGVNVDTSNLSAQAQTVIATGVKNITSNNFYVKDSITGIKYWIYATEAGALYLSLRSPKGYYAYHRDYGPEARVITTPALSSAPKQVIESRKRPPLPAEAATLHEQLLKAVKRLKNQKLAAEVTHQVDRTTETVETVLTKYYDLAELDATEEDNADLVQFFRNQIRFIDDLTVEHAQGVRKELSMELVAAEEIIRLNSLHLGAKR
jgi:hypothetical protein